MNSPRHLSPSQQMRAGKDYVRRQYGHQTSRILYGRDDDSMED